MEGEQGSASTKQTANQNQRFLKFEEKLPFVKIIKEINPYQLALLGSFHRDGVERQKGRGTVSKPLDYVP